MNNFEISGVFLNERPCEKKAHKKTKHLPILLSDDPLMNALMLLENPEKVKGIFI